MTRSTARRGARIGSFAIGLWCLLAIASAAAQDVTAQRGQALYETRCVGCHDRSVHQRASRRAASFEALRAAVLRWDRQQGGLWRDDELDAVARYLNERYYRLPCPKEVCSAEPAELRTPVVRPPA